jgi:ketosteroid isomerase-like protein
MQSEEEEVTAANEAFYRAFESLNIKEMEKVWARDRSIQCGHPGWRILRGWEAVMESWRRIFENTSEIRFSLVEVTVHVRGGVALVTLYESLISSAGSQKVSATVLTTNVFEKSADGWRMILHHGSSVLQEPPPEPPPTVH